MGELKEKRILILCVDRDDDLNAKAQVKTPVIGRAENLDASVQLALRDPEETDANAMFEAVRTYDHLLSEGKLDESIQIATISGSQRGGVSADRKLAGELDQLLKAFPATEVVMVSDGYSDEAILPIVESRAPVVSVRRIVVKHSERIEESAALFSRYLRMIVENPRYSRFALGLPGLLILILGVLSLFGLVTYYLLTLAVFLSAIMVIKGFGLDKVAKRFYYWAREYSPPPLRVQISGFAVIVGIICMILGAYYGWTDVAGFVAERQIPQTISAWFSIMPQATGIFIKGAVTLIVVGMCVTFLGRAIRWYLERDSRLLRNAALIFTIAWSRQIFYGTADVLIKPELGYEKLIFAIVVGMLIGIASFLIIIVVHRSASGFFEGTGGQDEDFSKE